MAECYKVRCVTYEDLLAVWPNCSVPDCEYKACLPDDKCFAHSRGKIPIPFDEYMSGDQVK